MYFRILLAVALLLTMSSFSYSETMEEFLKLKASDEQTGLIPKGGPRIISKDVIVEQLKKDCEVTFESDAVLFHYGLAKIKDESMQNVQNAAAAIKQAMADPQLNLIRTYYVDGHTCAIGSDDNNCRLSWSRAQAMIDELIRLGVPRERLIPRGFGESSPAQSNDTEATRMMNRRVVLKGDCPQKTAKNNAVPCRIQNVSQPNVNLAGTGGTNVNTNNLDTSELDTAIANLQNQLVVGGTTVAAPIPIPVGMMIPMGKAAAGGGKPLPSGFKRTGPEASSQSVEKTRQTGKSTVSPRTQEQSGQEGKAKELPRGFKKVE